jgi:hypothetical protein
VEVVYQREAPESKASRIDAKITILGGEINCSPDLSNS